MHGHASGKGLSGEPKADILRRRTQRWHVSAAERHSWLWGVGSARSKVQDILRAAFHGSLTVVCGGAAGRGATWDISSFLQADEATSHAATRLYGNGTGTVCQIIFERTQGFQTDWSQSMGVPTLPLAHGG